MVCHCVQAFSGLRIFCLFANVNLTCKTCAVGVACFCSSVLLYFVTLADLLLHSIVWAEPSMDEPNQLDWYNLITDFASLI